MLYLKLRLQLVQTIFAFLYLVSTQSLFMSVCDSLHLYLSQFTLQVFILKWQFVVMFKDDIDFMLEILDLILLQSLFDWRDGALGTVVGSSMRWNMRLIIRSLIVLFAYISAVLSVRIHFNIIKTQWLSLNKIYSIMIFGATMIFKHIYFYSIECINIYWCQFNINYMK